MDSDYDAVVITHGGCADGTAAAHMFELFPIPNIRVYYSYNRDFSKNRDMPSLAGKSVYICDYSFPIETLLEIARTASHLYLWDHHETAMKDLFASNDGKKLESVCADFTIVSMDISNYVIERRITGDAHCHMLNKITLTTSRIIEEIARTQPPVNACKVNIVLDMNLCGTEIVFRELSKKYGKRNAPWYLTHIRDRDLWLWDRPGFIAGVHYCEKSKAFGEAFFELRICNETLRAFDSYTQSDIGRLYERGEALMEHNARLVKMIVSKALRTEFEGYPAMVAQSQVLQSEIGNTIVKTEFPITGAELSTFKPVIGIIIRYDFCAGLWNVSMRGREGSPNLATIAKKYGGGGHPMASGFDYAGNIMELFKVLTLA
jgi:hypothetical protein